MTGAFVQEDACTAYQAEELHFTLSYHPHFFISTIIFLSLGATNSTDYLLLLGTRSSNLHIPASTTLSRSKTTTSRLIVTLRNQSSVSARQRSSKSSQVYRQDKHILVVFIIYTIKLAHLGN